MVQPTKTKTMFACVMLAMALLLSGCGGNTMKGLVNVEGTVTLDGNPLPEGTVTFMPVDVSNGGSPSSGKIDSNGSYELQFSKSNTGIKPGTYVVTVNSWETVATMDAKGKAVPGKSRIPEKYSSSDASRIEITVNDESSQTFPIELTSS